jgi:hypothetical protein
LPDPVPNAEILRSLGRLVRGLSALFWGLPIALIVCFHTARAEALRSFGVVPPMVCTGWLVYGLWQLGAFQKQERVWRRTLDHARILGLINFGLSPFLYWWSRVPGNPFFFGMVLLIALCSLLFLSTLNLVLQRLGAMLPDEALRLEVKQFTALNLNLLLGMLFFAFLYLALSQVQGQQLPPWLRPVVVLMDRGSLWFLIPLLLLPLAMTMALLWKTKEVILDNVFGSKQ